MHKPVRHRFKINKVIVGAVDEEWEADLVISDSLIIHKIKTKKINTETKFGYVMKHLHKIKPTFISIFPLNTNLFEMLYQTLEVVKKTRPTTSFFNPLLGVWIS